MSFLPRLAALAFLLVASVNVAIAIEPGVAGPSNLPPAGLVGSGPRPYPIVRPVQNSYPYGYFGVQSRSPHVNHWGYYGTYWEWKVGRCY